MIRSNSAILLKSVIWDLGGNIIYFPIWWYTRGLRRVSVFLMDFVKGMEMRLAVRVWVKNILKPMYAVSDIPGRIISFFMRLAMIIVRGLGMFFIIIGALLALAFYLLWPPFVIMMILLQLGMAVV